MRTEIIRYKDNSLYLSPTTKKLHDSLEKASIKSQPLYATSSLRETRQNFIQSINHILKHDLVREDPLTARFVSEMEKVMQDIKERFNTQILSLLGLKLVKIMSYVFHSSTIRREMF